MLRNCRQFYPELFVSSGLLLVLRWQRVRRHFLFDFFPTASRVPFGPSLFSPWSLLLRFWGSAHSVCKPARKVMHWLALAPVAPPVSFSPLPFSLAHRVSLLFLCVSLYAQASCVLLKAIVHDHSLVCCRKGGMVDNHGWLETGWWRMGCRFCTKQCV